ncbi:hypothetical protein Btru_062097 [Bulinus truncatus]|nr:hypothetical protein Btru_062097 [Bulinus truncatus]
MRTFVATEIEMKLKCYILATVIVAFLSLVLVEPAAIAKNEYTMDVRSDCVAAGYLDISRDQVTYVNGRSTNTVNQQLTCFLQFNPQTDGDTLKMWVESGAYVGDCDVFLEMTMSDNKYVFGCQSAQNSIPTYEMVNGRAALRLVRKSFGDTDYNFRIGISAKRSIDPVAAGDSSSGNIGMIVGIVVGIVAAIVIAIIVCVCCYRKKRNDQSRNKGLLTKDPLSASSTCTFENAAAKNSPLDYPNSEKKLLEYENENKLKPKSALERFGPSPGKLQNNSDINRDNSRDNNRDYQRDNNREYHRDTSRDFNRDSRDYSRDNNRDNSRDYSRDNNRDNSRDYSRDVKRKDNDVRLNNTFSNKDKSEFPEKIPNIPKAPPAPPAPPIEMLTRQSSVATSSSENASDRNSQNNVFFAALRNNPKFRKSFRENEADADDRARRVSSHTSTSSMASDTSKTHLPLIPPIKSVTTQSQKPQLPPIPKPRPRPSSPERLGEIAGIHQARPSSASESLTTDDAKESRKFELQKKSTEVPDAKFQKTDNRKKNVSKNAQSSDSDESILERGRPKHRNKSNERSKEPKSRQHADKKSQKKNESDYSSSESDGSELNHGKSKRRHRSDDRNKESRRNHSRDKLSRKNVSKDDHSSESEESEVQNRRSKSRNNKEVNRKQELKEPVENQDREKERDYERKFKKSTTVSTGVRKSKGKGANKMSRSRSTGSALEELESNYSQSKSQGSVRSLNLNFVDEDIDLDSNLQTFKRAESKTSLYASRTSLYGRRRKNSMGETVSLSSYMYDDVESRISDFDRASISQKDKARMFKSTGDLELKLQSSVIVRDCSTWTGSSKGVEVFERKTLTRSKPDKRYNRGTQTGSDRDRTNSIASEASVYSTHRLKSRSKSQESLGSDRRRRTHKKDHKARSPHHSRSDVRSNEGKKRSKSRAKSSDSDSTAYTLDTSDGSGRTDQSSVKPKLKPKPKQQMFEAHNTDTSFLENESVISVPSSSYIPYQPPVNAQYIPVNYPISSYPQHGPNYLVPPPNSVPIVVQNIPMIKPAVPPKPHQAPPISSSKWDQLVNLTEGMKKRRHQMGESVDTESVMSSAWSEFVPYGGQHQLHFAPVNDPNLTYSTSYPESSGPQYGMYHNESDL